MPHGWRWVLCPIDTQWKCSPLKAVGLPLIPMAVFQLGCGMSDCLVYLSFCFVLFCLYCCEKYHDQKQFGKVLFRLAAHHKGKSGQELKAGPKAAIMEKCYCVAHFVLYIQRASCKGMALPTVGGSFHISHQSGKCPAGLPTAQCGGWFFQLGFSLLRRL